ncbi:unannotated protein [freshwater metagenome]|uniref:Unannotated protein n=1 Tax=freshwater metagenome TaxID=449393 RepID=A0A6J7H8R6_9ZZZZ
MDTVANVAQRSGRSNARCSCPPSISARPASPTTRAFVTRGESPRPRISIRRSPPTPKRRVRASAEDVENVRVQRYSGDPARAS